MKMKYCSSPYWPGQLGIAVTAVLNIRREGGNLYPIWWWVRLRAVAALLKLLVRNRREGATFFPGAF